MNNASEKKTGVAKDSTGSLLTASLLFLNIISLIQPGGSPAGENSI